MVNRLSHKILLTCEHAGYDIPEKYRLLFRDAGSTLKSHRGWDPGAMELAESLSESWRAPLLSYPYSRLLIEPNRSEHHHKLFSEYSKCAGDEIKAELLERFYRPYREKIVNVVRESISNSGRLLHISVHTFTPVLCGKSRDFDIGLLYDPGRSTEKQIAAGWKTGLSEFFHVRMNQPYKGTADGLTTALRNYFPAEQYIGIELEVNQKYYFKKNTEWLMICRKIAECNEITA